MIAICAIGSTASAGQRLDANDLASQISSELEVSRITHYAVFDFINQDSQVTLLGRNLANEISEGISKSDPKLKPADRPRLAAKIEGERFSPAIVQDREIATWLADNAGAQAFIQGKLSSIPGGDNLSLLVQVTRVRDKKGMGSWKVTFDATDEDKLANSENLDPDAQVMKFDAVKGTTWPTCIRCPNPSFTTAAEHNHTQETVMLSAVIGKDQKARDLLVTQHLADGLTLQAVQAVQSWIFRSARTPEGNPVDVRIIIEMAFRFY